MARRIGAYAKIYLGTSAGTAAVNVPDLESWGIDQSRPLVALAACNDGHVKYAAGIPDAKGEGSVLFDDANAANLFLSAAVSSGVNMYGYPSSLDMTKYVYGSVILGGTKFTTGGLTGASKLTFTWGAADTLTWKLS